MKKRTLLKYIIKTKRYIQSLFNIKQNNVLLDKQKLIMELLFKDIDTKNSIELYNTITEKFFKELKNRENKAKSEIQTISVFMSDNESYENGKIVPLIFQKVLEEQKI